MGRLIGVRRAKGRNEWGCHAQRNLNHCGKQVEKIACEAQAKSNHNDERRSAQFHAFKCCEVGKQTHGKEDDVGCCARNALGELKGSEGREPKKQTSNRSEHTAGKQRFVRGGLPGQSCAHDECGRGAQGESDGKRVERAFECGFRVNPRCFYDA